MQSPNPLSQSELPSHLCPAAAITQHMQRRRATAVQCLVKATEGKQQLLCRVTLTTAPSKTRPPDVDAHCRQSRVQAHSTQHATAATP